MKIAHPHVFAAALAGLLLAFTPPASGQSGGTITNSGSYTIHTFTSNGTLTVPAGLVADVVLVGGGGGGGAQHAGGGGAGGLVAQSGITLNAGTYAINIGGGGGGCPSYGAYSGWSGQNGGNTTAFGLTAFGGGAGGGTNGNNGGSGGGANASAVNGFAGTPGVGSQGYNGGFNSNDVVGGGGGGGLGSAGNLSTGGAAATNWAGTFGGGGGGGFAGGAGGGAGAGHGGSGGAAGGHAAANTGSGGGGGGNGGAAGGNGGSGIVVIRYLSTPPARSVTISAPASVAAGQAFSVPATASTAASDAEQIGLFHAEYSTNGGTSWSSVALDANVGKTATRTANITAGAAGSTILVRVRIAFRGGVWGDVDYNNNAINWTAWNNWQAPPAKIVSIPVVAPTPATFAVAPTTLTYTGSVQGPTITPTPSAATYAVTGTGTATNAGSYTLTATANGMYSGTSGAVNWTINKAPATVTLGGLNQGYNGTPRSATATTNPSGLAVSFTYNGSSTVPTAMGSYAVVGTINNANYEGSASGTLVIGKGTAIVTLSNMTRTYTGAGLAATVTTNPAGLPVSVTYDGSATPPSVIGFYDVVATVNDANYDGSATGTFSIAPTTASQTPATGGAVTQNGGYTIHTFTSNGTLTVPAGLVADVVLVGGGGGGGAQHAGGGGAGGLVAQSGITLNAGTYAINIGGGGGGCPSYGAYSGWSGQNGGNTTAFGLTAFGGGAGGGTNGNNGGSGGGANASAVNGFAGTPGVGSQGYNGGFNSNDVVGGGGGGGLGSAGNLSTGGAAATNWAGTFGGGGGGGFAGGAGGGAGAGHGGSGGAAGGHAAANTGSGGGGGGNGGAAGGNGGSGIVVIRYQTTVNHAPSRIVLSLTGNTLGYNSTNVHFVIWSGNAVTFTSKLQDPDGNLANHTLRYQQITGSAPVGDGWVTMNNPAWPGQPSPSVPTNGFSSVKTASPLMIETPGRWEFNSFGHDGLISHPGDSLTLWVYGQTNGATFVSQSINGTALTGANPALTLNSGALTATATIRMQNTGNKPWENPDTALNTPHRLGAIGPNSAVWGATKRDMTSTLVDPVSLSPANNTATFTFDFNIPQTPGTYVFQWKMLEDGVVGDPYFEAATPAVTVTVVDTTPPALSSGPSAASITHDSFVLNWAYTDNVAVTGYEIARQEAGVVSTTTPTYTFTGLAADTAYPVRVRARDAAGNWSNWTSWLTVTTNLNPEGDYDNDGMSNGWEQTHGLDPRSSADTYLDPDNDGFTNIAEFNRGSDPKTYNQGTSNLGNAIPGGWPNGGINANLAVGATAGELNVDKSGAATYSIPLWTTPGTAGMEPKISLNYSSQAGPGIAGFGWSIGGISVITRGPKTIAVDGVARGVRYDAQDQFYLDGQRLIWVGGNPHGQSGAEYRTELETFTKVVANGPINNGPASFTAWTKDGLIIQFGHTADAAFNPGGGSTVHSWHANRISDTKGNYMDFVYEEVVNSAEGSHRLSRINYTGNTPASTSAYASLRFEYENRPDAVRGYSGGAPVSALKRLKAIRSYYGEDVARTYTLTYAERQYTGRSLLTSLTEAGAPEPGFPNGKPYPALTFDYGAPSYGWEQPGNFAFEPTYPLGDNRTSTQYSTGTGFIDLNGDGRTDFVVKRDGASADNAQLNTGTGWSDSAGYRLPYPLAISGNANDTGARFVDFDGDGLVDFVAYKYDTGVRHSWRNTGSGWDPVDGGWLLPVPTARDGGDYAKHGGRFVDLNGDGRVDYIAFLTVGGTRTNIAVYLNTGSGWAYDTGYNSLPGGSPPDLADKQARFIDLNGDSLPDIVVSYKDGTNYTDYVALNTGTGWEATGSNWNLPTWIAEKDKPRIGAEFVDLNGDGLPDLIWSRETPAPAVSGFALNTGAGWIVNPSGLGNFISPAELGRENLGSGGATFTDFNADGIPDLLMARYLNNNSSKSVHIGSYSGWQATSDTTWRLPEGGDLLVQSYNNVGADFVDFDGDGVADFVWKRWSPGGVVEKGLYRNKANPLADRLSKVTNGLGGAANLTYKTLLDSTVYTQGTGGPAGSVNLNGPMYVVSTVTHDDGVGGQYPVNYQYAGLRSERLRGSLGFEKMTVTDGRTAIRSETTFSQAYPTIGMPVASQTISGSTVLKDTSVTYGVKLFNSDKTRFVFAQISTETTKDLNGTSLGTTTTTIPTPATDIDDYGNIERIVVNTDGYTKTTDSLFTNNPTNWFLGRLTSATVVATASGQTTQTRSSSFTYNAAGLLETETVQPGDAVLGLTTTYGYDAFGNKTSVTVSGSGLTVDSSGNYASSGTVSRTTTTAYDTRGRFPSWTKNALNHQENYTGYDQVKGVLTSMTGANGLSTSWEYDSFGRKTKETRADGTITNTTYRWVSGAPAQAKYLPGAFVPVAKYHVETESTGAPPTLAFHDAFGRAFLALGVNGDGNIVYSTTHHDNMGRAHAASVPYLSSGTAYWTRTTSFDLLNRPVTVVTPDDENGEQTTSYTYNGLTVEVTDSKLRDSRTVKNSQGWTVENTRNFNNEGGASASTVTYTYDVLGNLTSTNAAGTGTSLAYDVRGRKTSMTDADMGTWQYRYNVFGELIWQKDQKGQITTMAYDGLGRLTSRTESEGTTTWTYDTSPTKGTGKLHTVSAPAGLASSAYTETYLYDSLGRPSQLTRQIDSNNYVTQTTYDSVGRVSRTVYPTGATGTFSTRNVYNAFGYLKEVRNWIASDDDKPNDQLQGRVYWMADTYDVTGRVDGETYGNGLANDRVYSSATGRLIRASSDYGRVVAPPPGQGYFIQDLNYIHDGVGNVLTRREDTPGNIRTETFTYDGLDRLTSHAIGGGATVTVGYDANGNIASKSDVGVYAYIGFGPHAVSAAGANAYTYDEVGNMRTGGGRTLDWTSFNQLKKVTQGTKSAEFAFGAGHERVLQVRRTVGTVTDRTVYVGALYERVLSTGGLIEHKHYILGPTGRIAVYTDRSDFTKDTRWFHTDGLGSITVISDEAGRVLKRHTYDAWGKQATSYTNTGAGITNTAPSTRGFTDHEMLGDFGLIHMNGRVYDPVLGRFLSADPNVDGVSDAQGYNRYSYVQNNPMNATDPSGYFSLKDALKIVAAVVVGVVTAGIALYAAGFTSFANVGFLSLGGAISSAATGSFVTLGLSSAIIGGAGFGFGSAFAGTLLNGGSVGDAFKAGLIGGVVGGIAAGITHGIGTLARNHDWGTFRTALAHGAAQGGITEAAGGEFRHGFYSGLFGHAAADPISTNIGGGARGQTIAAAIVGGTASAIGGGKFANGAMSGAFTFLFNYLAHSSTNNAGIYDVAFYDMNDRDGEYADSVSFRAAARRYGKKAVGVSSLEDIHAYLKDHPYPYDSIAIFGHGYPGAQQLTNDQGKMIALLSRNPTWEKIGTSMSMHGKIYLFGCNVAENVAGAAYLQRIADASKLTVLGSEHYVAYSNSGSGKAWFIANYGEPNAKSIQIQDYNWISKTPQ